MQASRALFKFEEIIRPALEREEITLTGLCLLSPHLTESNIKPLIEESKNQSTRKIEKVILEHCPEVKRKKFMNLEIDEEFENLLDKAKILFSDKDNLKILKKALSELTREKKTRVVETQKHTRYVQVSLKREVREKANFRCTYMSSAGVRCNQTAHLEIDHIRPWAMGGSSREIENLRVLCKAHNLLKAGIDFPKQNIARYGEGRKNI